MSSDVFCHFSYSIQAKDGTLPSIRPRSLLSVSFSCYYSQSSVYSVVQNLYYGDFK